MPSGYAEIIVACITGILTLVGVMYSNTKHNEAITSLIDYRMDIIEKKQDKYNNIIERMQTVETTITVLDERQKNITNRVDDLEDKVK